MDDLGDDADFWLEGGVVLLNDGAENGFLPEVDRIIDLLGEDESWLDWWRSVSKAPVLELQIFVLKPPRSLESEETLVSTHSDERVVRGRKRHLVRMHVDFNDLAELEPDERRLHALPAVVDGISRARQGVKLDGDPPPIPAAVQPAPLSAGTLRRRRLRELLDARGLSSPRDPVAPPRNRRWGSTLTVSSVLRPERSRPTHVLAGSSDDQTSSEGLSGPRTSRADSPEDPTTAQLVVEIHVPAIGAGGKLPSDPGYEFGWIDEIEEFLDDEMSDGSFELYDDGEDFDGAYVFFITGADEDVLLAVAADVAALPGIPRGTFAIVTDDQSEEMGTGRRVPLT